MTLDFLAGFERVVPDEVGDGEQSVFLASVVSKEGRVGRKGDRRRRNKPVTRIRESALSVQRSKNRLEPRKQQRSQGDDDGFSSFYILQVVAAFCSFFCISNRTTLE